MYNFLDHVLFSTAKFSPVLLHNQVVGNRCFQTTALNGPQITLKRQTSKMLDIRETHKRRSINSFLKVLLLERAIPIYFGNRNFRDLQSGTLIPKDKI